jgi:hypothetical protein
MRQPGTLTREDGEWRPPSRSRCSALLVGLALRARKGKERPAPSRPRRAGDTGQPEERACVGLVQGRLRLQRRWGGLGVVVHGFLPGLLVPDWASLGWLGAWLDQSWPSFRCCRSSVARFTPARELCRLVGLSAHFPWPAGQTRSPPLQLSRRWLVELLCPTTVLRDVMNGSSYDAESCETRFSRQRRSCRIFGQNVPPFESRLSKIGGTL